MPHFTLQVDALGAPMIVATVGVSEPRAAALIQAGMTVPNPFPIRGLVDTGASQTCIDPLVFANLGLVPTGDTGCLSPTTGVTAVRVDLYDVSLRIPAGSASQAPLYFSTLAAMASELFAAQGFHALIGRDVLGDCFFGYNGSARIFTIAF